ncbi:MAG: hypothetical protein A2X82_04625 [Geobacteraceae bacterium GWC2_55_20]|nr:MAG: hypothetical protein A2X82_04625 [Geobacteraceae bacterium GWC2_55_20]OGU21734.1 MAG: hypothetical protein A2X85_12125 [Geobacteraceae bacterium GWF2_54_21]HBA70939.1 hypothetical protein [Geobacter sp.]HCE66908.1 hypothetical protein [Geobacter sp.]
MSKSINLIVALLLITVCVPLTVRAETVSRTVAVVNGVDLSEADLNQEINTIMPMSQPFHGKISDEKKAKIRSDAMKVLVDYELMAQDALGKGIKIPQAVIDGEMDKLVKKFKSKKDLVKAYKGAGFTDKTFLRIMQRRLLAEKIHALEVDGKVSVTPEKLKSYYDSNISKYNKPEEFRASHILIKVDPSSNKEKRLALRASADSILKRLKDGEKFEEIAVNESDDDSKNKGGDLGYFHAGQTIPEFNDALTKLKVGETSPVVESLYGFHIIRLTDKRPARQIPFDEVQDKIKKDMVATQKKQLQDEWMDGLHKKAKIIYPGEK